MVISSSNNLITTRYRVRSSSFPSNPDPFLQRLQHHLHSLQHRLDSSSAAAAANISAALSGVADLYSCAEEALTLPRPQHRGNLDGLLDASLKLLDAAGVARDAVARLKEAAIDLQSALRRRRESESVEELVAKYTRSRKAAMRSAKSALLGLKKIASGRDDHNDLNDDVLSCVGVMSVSVIESLLAFVSTPPAHKCKLSGWRVVSRLMAARGEENELTDSDAALHGLVCGCGKIGLDRYGVVQETMERLERGLEGMEEGLNGLFRQLVKTRASLLNVISS